MTNIIKDVSLLSTIPEKSLNKLIQQKFVYCICEAIQEDILEGKNMSKLDIGLGILYIGYEDNEIKYKFEPSTQLLKSVNSTVLHKENILEDVLNNALAKKFIDVYKDIC